MKVGIAQRLILALVVWIGWFRSNDALADTVYVWSWDGSITKIASNGVSTVIGNLSGWNGPIGLTIDPSGRLLTGSPCDSSIRRFLPDGASNVIGFVDSVSALGYDRSAILYTSIPNYSEICHPHYTPGYGYGCGIFDPYTQSQLTYPTSIAFDTDGVLFVANGVQPIFSSTNPPANTVQMYSKSLQHLGTFASGIDQPWGLAFDAVGNLFVSSYGKNRIYRYTPDGVGVIFAFSSSGLRGPQGLAFDSEGHLYVANSLSNNILMFQDSAFGDASVFASGLSSPCAIAIEPGLRSWDIPPARLTEAATQADGAFHFSFTNSPDLNFMVLASSDPSQAASNWVTLGPAAEIYSGLYFHRDYGATNNHMRCYRVRRE